jgi:enoyl-CoA hydratase
VATIVLNRPAKRNALTIRMWEALPSLVERAEQDSRTRVLVLRGVDQSAFAAGADIAELMELKRDIGGLERYSEAAARAEDALARCTKPTLAAIRGPCIGGGCELALACDFRLADSSASFAIPPARLGLVYAPGATRRLVDVVGLAGAKYLLLTARAIGAQDALDMRLVTRLVPAVDFEVGLTDFLRDLSKLSPTALRGMKAILSTTGESGTEPLTHSLEIARHAFHSADFEEGIRAYLERRPPAFE